MKENREKQHRETSRFSDNNRATQFPTTRSDMTSRAFPFFTTPCVALFVSMIAAAKIESKHKRRMSTVNKLQHLAICAWLSWCNNDLGNGTMTRELSSSHFVSSRNAIKSAEFVHYLRKSKELMTPLPRRVFHFCFFLLECTFEALYFTRFTPPRCFIFFMRGYF